MSQEAPPALLAWRDDAYDGVGVMDFRGANLILDIVHGVGHMLEIQPYAIDAATGGDLGGARVGEI